MMRTASAKQLLDEYFRKRYNEFILNADEQLSLPALSLIPWITTGNRDDVYKKNQSRPNEHHIKFITKNDKPYSFAWQTNAAKLKEGVRWGIVRSQSITSNVISTLGQYRIIAHERAIKGFVSNSQAVKLKLIDLFQDRFEALQALESLANKNTTHQEYKSALKQYIHELTQIESQLHHYFDDVDCGGFNAQSLVQIKADIAADIKRAQAYLLSISSNDDLRAFNRSRGRNSVLEFVKQQMMHGLYELQGINQDMTFSRKRFFALTRGELNDCIEDARKVIDDHEADARNVTTDKHHGIYSKNPDELFTYDFSHDSLPSARQQQVLTAISFIEGWDVLTHTRNKQPTMSNGIKEEELQVYAATRWRTHRSSTAALKSLGSFVLNILKSMFVPTRLWLEEDWNDKEFHLNAALLHQHVQSNEPMWKKPVYFIIQVAYAIMDVFKGVRDSGVKLVVELPEDIGDDWEATKCLPNLDETLTSITTTVNVINHKEERLLREILVQYHDQLLVPLTQETSHLAHVEYDLSAGEFNDILNSIARGITSFGTVFSHNIYAKDPVGGLIFSATYSLGVAMIYSPDFCSSFLGQSFVSSCNNMFYSMSASPVGAAVTGGSSLAEFATVLWDGVMHGPTGMGANTFYQLGEDPLTVGAYCASAYALGYFMANGVMGHKIPWLTDELKKDLGADPSTGYPLIGAKMAIATYEVLMTHTSVPYEAPHLMNEKHPLAEDARHEILRFKLVNWLARNAKTLPKLPGRQQFALERQMDALFTKEESKSLKKLLYPENHSSIAFQFFAIPLAYVPVVLRVLASPLVSFAAWFNQNSHPTAPMHRSFDLLMDHLKKDFMRLAMVTTKLVFLTYTGVATFVKLFAYLCSMAIGRVAGLFDNKPAHALHRVFAMVHTTMRSMGEFFYPARAMKDSTVAHPTDTMIKTQSSYDTLLDQLKVTTADADKPEQTKQPEEQQKDYSEFILLNRDKKTLPKRVKDDDRPEPGVGL
ncbi:MAG: hypothetical protein QM652_09245 [Legionella sp.]|uniref:hypothetical protein n=1 Tax=Legionella sp. TaxID=459 RepID=UPI0039E42250